MRSMHFPIRLALLALIFAAVFMGIPSARTEQTSAAHSDVSAQSPLSAVESTIQRVLDVVEKLPGDSAKASRRAELREVIAPRFNFDEMAKRSLGAYWRECTPAQQKEFVDVFSELLASTYLARIENIKRDMVQYKGETIDSGRALVKTTVTNKGDTFPIDYRLALVDTNWKVYDVIIENVGLVANYRNEFAGIIRKERISGLIEKLKSKVAKS